MHYLLITAAVCVFVGVPCLIAVARDKLAELQRCHQIEEALAAEGERQRDREAFERLIHPSAGNGLCDIDKEWR